MSTVYREASALESGFPARLVILPLIYSLFGVVVCPLGLGPLLFLFFLFSFSVWNFGYLVWGLGFSTRPALCLSVELRAWVFGCEDRVAIFAGEDRFRY